MAFKLDITNLMRNFAACMNIGIALLMIFGLWCFLTQDGMHANLSWLIWVPLATLIFIGVPLWITWSLFSDGSQKLRIVFLILNISAFLLMLFGIFADHWVTTSSEAPISFRSIAKMCLILGTPFLVNMMTLIFLLSRKRIA